MRVWQSTVVRLSNLESRDFLGVGGGGGRGIYTGLVPNPEYTSKTSLSIQRHIVNSTWLKRLSSTNVLIGHSNHMYILSLDTTIMVSKNCPMTDEHD